MHPLTYQESYFYYSSTVYAIMHAQYIIKTERIPAFITFFSSCVCMWLGGVCTISCLLMLSRHPIGHTVEELPVPSKQNSQIEFSDNVLQIGDADKCHINSEGNFLHYWQQNSQFLDCFYSFLFKGVVLYWLYFSYRFQNTFPSSINTEYIFA